MSLYLRFEFGGERGVDVAAGGCAPPPWESRLSPFPGDPAIRGNVIFSLGEALGSGEWPSRLGEKNDYVRGQNKSAKKKVKNEKKLNEVINFMTYNRADERGGRGLTKIYKITVGEEKKG